MKSNGFRMWVRAGQRRVVATWVVGVATLLGCSRTEQPSGQPSEPAPSASIATTATERPKTPGLVNALPIPDAELKKYVNPKDLPVHTGPTATVRGIVTITGDPAPELPEVIAKIPEKCKSARGVYGRLFREGVMRSVADALVTVTGYPGYIPPLEEAVRVVGRDCAWDRLTIGVMYGQRIEVSSRGTEPYMPQLMGVPSKAMMVAVPRGEAVKLYPHRPGSFALIDNVHAGMTASVFVVMFPTFDVTGLDGRYEIARIPPGEVTVSARLPVIAKLAHQKIRVEGGKTYDVNLELSFDAKKDVLKTEAKPEKQAKTPPATR